MGGPARQLKTTPQEYLAFERASDERHEYVDGEIFAMSGGTREHSLVGHNVEVALGNALGRGSALVRGGAGTLAGVLARRATWGACRRASKVRRGEPHRPHARARHQPMASPAIPTATWNRPKA